MTTYMHRHLSQRQWDAALHRLAQGREQRAREAEMGIARAIQRSEPNTSRDDALRRAASIYTESEQAKWLPARAV